MMPGFFIYTTFFEVQIKINFTHEHGSKRSD